MSQSAPLVIVGTGLAGYNLAKEIRKLDDDRELLLVTADDGRFYSKPLLSTGFAKAKEAHELAMQDAVTMAEQLNARILTHTQVSAIDPERRVLQLGENEQPYSELVLAVGAEPRRLPWTDALGERLLSINDLLDYGRFRSALAGKRSVLIIGAGLIGCEFANDLVAGGFQVTVVASDPYLMPQLIPEPVAAAVQAELEMLGVEFHLGCAIESVLEQGEGISVRLDNGIQIAADQALSAIGLAPRLTLAEQAGLQIGRGIVVDRRLATSQAHIYALGDCAEVHGLNLMYVMPLMTAARALAKTLCGTDHELSYPAMPVMVKTPACPLVVAPPLTAESGHWTTSGSGSDLQALFHDEQGRLHGFALTGSRVAEKLKLSRELPGWLLATPT
ncbi:MAG: FAD-dependent oxidoreductase [Halopseudomonas sp.]|uniref:NAD(P)/FAD-dependent oxidoreductase n=1 Tax=Halopseudomonas sp. TaxID=2901191 RepID=UPI003001D837